jgi:DNA-binding MarR family transcriptional regulator
VLTEKGAKLYKTAIPLFEKSVEEVFAVLPRPEQKELSSLLRRLNQEAPAS